MPACREDRKVPLALGLETGSPLAIREPDEVPPVGGHRGPFAYRGSAYRPDMRGSGGGRHPSPLLFVVFALLLAGLVLAGLVTIGRPLIASTVVSWAGDNPGALSNPVVADFVRDDLGGDLARPASSDPSEVPFTIAGGDTTRVLAQRLVKLGLLLDSRAFILTALDQGTADTWLAGDYVLRANMTPADLIATLRDGPPPQPIVAIFLRPSLRLEQIAAKLLTLTDQKPALEMKVQAFLDIVRHPSAKLLASYPWLQLEDGASLEGYLAGGTYQVKPDITADAFVRLLLDQFYRNVGPERMNVPEERGMTFGEILTLASIVEQEAALDKERALIAGVYQNRVTKKMLLNADPTVIYANDTVQLGDLALDIWPQFSFWNVPKAASMAAVEVPAALAGYQSYQVAGLPPGPICTPTVASIDAALEPNTKGGYLYFVAKNDGSRSHAFAKTEAQHLANLKKYGYIK